MSLHVRTGLSLPRSTWLSPATRQRHFASPLSILFQDSRVQPVAHLRLLSTRQTTVLRTNINCPISSQQSTITSPFNTRQPGQLSRLAGIAWTRAVHCKACRAKKKRTVGDIRNKSSTTNGSKQKGVKQAPTGSPPKPQQQRPAPPPPPPPSEPVAEKPPVSPKPSSPETHVTHTTPLLDRLPHSLHGIHRPTKDELLAAATGFWSRLKVRFKWVTIKSARPFNIDEIGAFFSWILAAHFLWILLGTTTFFSLILFLVNSVFAQETLARWTGNYLTKSSGLRVVFESAIVPKWGDGVISFKKVFVSRRPGNTKSTVSKGSQLTAAAAAAAAQHERGPEESQEEEEDTNYTQFDVSIETVNVTLSFAKWWNGKGLLRDVEMKGVRGVVDRTYLQPTTEEIDPRSYKHEHNPGDFELDSFKMEDLLVTVYQPGGFRPFAVSIFSCDLPQLRKQFLFYDFMSASNISGSFDNSLFTIHPRQTHSHSGTLLSSEEGIGQWKKQTRVRIDGLNIDHLNRGAEGPFSWIHEGNVDIVADIMFPNENDDSIAKVMSDFYDRVEATVTSNTNKALSAVQAESNDQPLTESTPEEELSVNEDDNRFVIMDMRVSFNNVQAAVPIFTHDISYVNNALIRPIVAYINSRKEFIPVNCRVVKRLSEFDGSWTLYDSGLMDDLSKEMYEAFARDVLNDNQARKRRFKKVGIWTLQLAAQALFIGLAGNIA